MKIEVKPSIEVPNDPVPSRSGGRRYPFDQMLKVGDAFKIDSNHFGAGKSETARAVRVANAAANYARKNGVKFRCECQTDGGVRVERIA